MNKTVVMLVASLALLSGCAGGKPAEQAAPAWVQGNSAKYGPAQYITGRGTGATLEQAQNQARADLAKFFSVAVRESGVDIQSFSNQQGGEPQSAQQVTRRLETYTDQVVQGIEIVERWHDPVSGSYHALAVAPRAATIVRLQNEISRLDADAQRQFAVAQAESEPLLSVAAVHKAVILQQQRSGVQRSLQAIDPTGQGVPARWSVDELKVERDDRFSRIRVRVVTESVLDGFTPLFSAALARTGMRVRTGAEVDYQVSGALRLDAPMYNDGWHWQRGTLTLTLSRPDGSEMGVRQWSVKASAQQRDQLTARVLESLGKSLDNELRDTLLDFAQR